MADHLPNDKETTTHLYGLDSFKLHGLPVARPGEVLGLIGTNGIGKSTTLNVLAGILQPNLGRLNNPPELQEIPSLFRNKELQTYLNQILQQKLKVAMKPQEFKGMGRSTTEPNARSLLGKYDERLKMTEICDDLELNEFLDKPFIQLTYGQLQRVLIASVALQKADVYIFDEPSSFLDVRERFKAARVIRTLLTRVNYVIVADHDLSLLDYLSNTVYCLHGKPGEYGILSRAYNARDGLNMFLTGFDPITSLRIRDDSLIFQFPTLPPIPCRSGLPFGRYSYPDMSITFPHLKLDVTGGEFITSQILVVLGQNGTGKSTFIRMLAGLEDPDDVDWIPTKAPWSAVSYKKQDIVWKTECRVRQLPYMRYNWSEGTRFASEVMKPLQIDQLMEREASSLSPGESERVAIAVCLGRPAAVYLIDEPSAHLDAEERVNVALAIKRHMLTMKSTAIVVEHDFMMATYLADLVIVAERRGSNHSVINPPCPLNIGMNRFLSHLDIITFRQDPVDYVLTPRINKLRSIHDMEQKATGQYYKARRDIRRAVNSD